MRTLNWSCQWIMRKTTRYRGVSVLMADNTNNNNTNSSSSKSCRTKKCLRI